MELVNAFEKSTGQKIAYQIDPRRGGDLPAFWADPSRALNELSWKTELSIDDMCKDTWNWQSQNPNGYTA